MKPLLDSVTAFFNKGLAAKARREQMAGHRAAEMTIVSHVVELRKHVVLSIAYFLGFTILALIFMERVVKFLRMPFEEYQLAKGKSAALMAIGLFEVILMNFKICFVVGLVCAAPFIIRELWRFVSPALYDHEKKIALPVVLSSIVLFYAGISFGFFVIVPSFLGNTLDWAAPYADVHLTVDNYFSSLSTMVMIFGIIFEVPVLMSLLGMVGIVSSTLIARNRRAVLLGSFIIGAVISPPDVMSQVIVSLPLYAMMEVSIVALRIIEKKRAAALEETLRAGGGAPDSPATPADSQATKPDDTDNSGV